MLIRIGKYWIDPSKVEFIDPDVDMACYVHTNNKSYPVSINADDVANTINSYGQTFGGEGEDKSS